MSAPHEEVKSRERLQTPTPWDAGAYRPVDDVARMLRGVADEIEKRKPQRPLVKLTVRLWYWYPQG